jgi:hypothetical protein
MGTAKQFWKMVLATAAAGTVVLGAFIANFRQLNQTKEGRPKVPTISRPTSTGCRTARSLYAPAIRGGLAPSGSV